MKIIVVVLSIILGISLIGLGVSGAFLYKFWNDSNSKTSVIEEKDNQIRNLKSEAVSKDNTINKQKELITEKDKTIKKLNKDLKDKNDKVKKMRGDKKVNNNVADTGRYMSEDSTGIRENTSGDGPGYTGYTNEIIITECSEEYISFDLEEWSGAHQVMCADMISCQLKNRKGIFEFTNEGTSGEFECKGTIEILNNKRVKITSLTNDWWGKGESRIYNKE